MAYSNWEDGFRMYVPQHDEQLYGGTVAYNVTAAGAAYGTAKSGIGIAGVGTFRSDLIMKVPKSG